MIFDLDGVEVYESTLELIRALRARGATRVVSDLAELNPGRDRGVPQE